VSGLPWLAILDRDFSSQSERESWAGGSKYMWEGYAIETAFLNPQWLSAAVALAGGVRTPEDFRRELDELASRQIEQVYPRWMERELNRRVPGQSHPSDVATHLEYERDKADERLRYLQTNANSLRSDFDREWETRKVQMADPKRVLRELDPTPFRNSEALTDALIAVTKTAGWTWPEELALVRTLLGRQA
jgi:hypothetical protein